MERTTPPWRGLLPPAPRGESAEGNIPGKDYARKRNVRHGASITETTRATLGTIDYLNKVKREARLKKVEEDEAKKVGGEILSLL